MSPDASRSTGPTGPTGPTRPTWQFRLGACLLAGQACLVAASLFHPANDFAWGPYTTHVRYEITVDVGGQRLAGAAAARRYRLFSPPWESHSWVSLLTVIRQYETTYGTGDGARVRVVYRVNRGPERSWEWPE